MYLAKYYDNAVLNQGDGSRFKKVLDKAARGEDIFLGVIGGSITGIWGVPEEERPFKYPMLIKKWLGEKFPDINIGFVNAGVPGTGSMLGITRVDDQLLSHDPDLVIIEFSVNDRDNDIDGEAYEALCLKILQHKSAPALLHIATVSDKGVNTEARHLRVCEKYNIPFISVKEAIWPSLTDGSLKWSDYAYDPLHPGNNGHAIMAELIEEYLSGVCDTASADIRKTDNLIKGIHTPLMDCTQLGGDALNLEGSSFYKHEQYGIICDTPGGAPLVINRCCGYIILRYNTWEQEECFLDVIVDGEVRQSISGVGGLFGGPLPSEEKIIAGEKPAERRIELSWRADNPIGTKIGFVCLYFA
jgi:lysophospholipase L1-like esterase